MGRSPLTADALSAAFLRVSPKGLRTSSARRAATVKIVWQAIKTQNIRIKFPASIFRLLRNASLTRPVLRLAMARKRSPPHTPAMLSIPRKEPMFCPKAPTARSAACSDPAPAMMAMVLIATAPNMTATMIRL